MKTERGGRGEKGEGEGVTHGDEKDGPCRRNTKANGREGGEQVEGRTKGEDEAEGGMAKAL